MTGEAAGDQVPLTNGFARTGYEQDQSSSEKQSQEASRKQCRQRSSQRLRSD